MHYVLLSIIEHVYQVLLQSQISNIRMIYMFPLLTKKTKLHYQMNIFIYLLAVLVLRYYCYFHEIQETMLVKHLDSILRNDYKHQSSFHPEIQCVLRVDHFA